MPRGLYALALLTVLLPCRVCLGSDELLINGNFEQGKGFERGLEGWDRAWSRAPGIKISRDSEVRHTGQAAVRVEYPLAEDWSLSQARSLDVRPGEIYELTGWLRIEGEGSEALSVTLSGADRKVIDWSYGGQRLAGTTDWQRVLSRFVIPPGGATVLPRLTGKGPMTAWADDLTFRRVGAADLSKAASLPPSITTRNQSLEVTFHTTDGTLTLRDTRCGQVWSQRPHESCYVLDAHASDRGIEATLLDSTSALELQATFALDGEKPELIVELSGDGPMSRIGYPHPLASPAGSWLIMPLNEGIGYPVDDASLPPMSHALYGGGGLCMAWYGLTDLDRGLMTLVETPDDAVLDVPRLEGRLQLAPQWEAQHGRFGSARRLRYVAFDHGGYVTMAKRHRAHAQAAGLLKTLQQKRRENPRVDLLIGAVNVWAVGSNVDSTLLCEDLQSLGIDRILWSAGGSALQLERLNALPGVLTSRYDIYQDCMNPANFSKVRHVHEDWTSEGWPKDIMIDASGAWIHGWGVEGKHGELYDCGVLCDRAAPAYARRRIAAELQTKPYRCRFLDTTTASPWRECYSPEHPLTRSESKRFKMELLDVVSREFGLVTGSENGHEAAVPYLHYVEGMLSLGPYRVEDSGRNTADIIEQVPEQVAKFQTGHFYRLPLWELVYHDCVVSHWYWGDYNNKLPELWDRRDLWNALYGTPPMFMFSPGYLARNRERFAQSYKTATPIAKATGYSEMLSHAWLNDDHSVQQTRFAGGVAVTVNFGEQPYRMADGTSLEPLGQRVEGLK
jgi:hypothetical protein